MAYEMTYMLAFFLMRTDVMQKVEPLQYLKMK